MKKEEIDKHMQELEEMAQALDALVEESDIIDKYMGVIGKLVLISNGHNIHIQKDEANAYLDVIFSSEGK